jgi:chromatin remodeling complex protein RSC6
MAKKKATKKATKKAATTTKAKIKKDKTKKAAKVSTTAKKAAKPKTKRKPNAAFMAALTPSSLLAAVVGNKPLPRTEVTKKLWAYIKSKNLQDPKNKRNIMADDKLRPIFGKDFLSMFDMTKVISKHLS